MGLTPEEKQKGNPAWKKGMEPANPGGRPKGSENSKMALKVSQRLLGKWKTHPVDKLVQLANHVSMTDPELAANIWMKLLSYMEPAKKPVETAPEKFTPEGSKEAAEATLDLIKQLEKDFEEPNGLSKPIQDSNSQETTPNS